MSRVCSVRFQADICVLERASFASPVWVDFKHGLVESRVVDDVEAFGLNTFNTSTPGQFAVTHFERVRSAFLLRGFAVLDEGLRQVEVEFADVPGIKHFVGTLCILSQPPG